MCDDDGPVGLRTATDGLIGHVFGHACKGGLWEDGPRAFKEPRLGEYLACITSHLTLEVECMDGTQKLWLMHSPMMGHLYAYTKLHERIKCCAR